MSSRTAKVAVLVAWAALLGLWAWHLRATDQDPASWLQGWVDDLGGTGWAVVAYVVAYLLRPLLLFPASLLTIASGVLFGPFLGVPLTLVAGTGSALVAYAIGRRLGPAALGTDGGGPGLLARWTTRMRREGFLAIVLMRLALLPFDLVSYGAGVLRIDPRAFAAATFLGSIPAGTALVLAGASLERLDVGLDGFDPRLFGASIAVLILSLAISCVVQRRAPSL